MHENSRMNVVIISFNREGKWDFGKYLKDNKIIYFEDLLDAILFTMSLLTLREENVLNHSTLSF